MKKTAVQLDREIAEALSGEHYYFMIDRRGGHRTIYGPFETLKDAEYAGYFAKPVADRDSEAAKGLIHVYFMRDVQQYSPEEIKVFSRDPEEYEMKSFKLRLGAPPIHPSWRALDKEFREELRDKDYDYYQQSMRR